MLDGDPVVKRLNAEIDRLTERCAAYKGQVEAGSHEIERLRAALKPFAKLDFRDNGRNGYVNPPVYTADIRRARELVGHQQSAPGKS